ncbi:MAG: ABC transporter ATP-binding protein [Nitrospirae bacterium]|nr:ABC transporter ATP-binding protein [Nitrospirota bacterium]
MSKLIKIEGLQRSFKIDSVTLEVLKGVDLEIKKGEILAIIGASGVGKSTLLHIIGTLERPTSGKVYFNEKDIFKLNNDELAIFRNKTIGFVFQFHHLLPEFTALENTMMPALINGLSQNDAEKKAKALLEEVGIGKRLHHKPGKLSGGEQQRVAIARALVLSPELVLADEPTGNLDTHTGEEIHRLLKEINKAKGTTFVLVTHNEKLASKADRIVKMVDGRIA